MAVESEARPSVDVEGALKQDFDANKAVEHARDKAEPQSIGQCGHYVRLSITAGNITHKITGSAKNFGPSLEAAGFVPALNQVDNFKQGDVVVIQGLPTTPLIDVVDPNGPRSSSAGLLDPPASAVLPHPQHGHIAIYDEKNGKWISDFEQDREEAFPGSPSRRYDRARPQYKVYRYLK